MASEEAPRPTRRYVGARQAAAAAAAATTSPADVGNIEDAGTAVARVCCGRSYAARNGPARLTSLPVKMRGVCMVSGPARPTAGAAVAGGRVAQLVPDEILNDPLLREAAQRVGQALAAREVTGPALKSYHLHLAASAAASIQLQL